MSGGPNTIVNAPNREVMRQKYDGTDAIEVGESFFGDSDEVNVVVRPTIAASRRFAGVSMEAQRANTTRNYIDLATPGSKSAQVAVAENVSIGDPISALVADGRGFFVKGGIAGTSTAVAKQATTNVLVSLLANTASVADDGITITLPEAVTTTAAGQTVQILSSAAGVLTGGSYKISSVTSTTVIVLTSTCAGSVLSGATKACLCIYAVKPLVYAEILDGVQTCGVQYINGIAATLTPTGVTVCQGNQALAADITVTIPAGEQGDFKVVKMAAAGITGGFVYNITPAAGVSLVDTDGTTDLASADLTNAATSVFGMQYIGTSWFLSKIVGVTETGS